MIKVKFGPGSQPEFLGKRTSSGLWLLCYTQRERFAIAITIAITIMFNFTIIFIDCSSYMCLCVLAGGGNFSCKGIDYFPTETYR